MFIQGLTQLTKETTLMTLWFNTYRSILQLPQKTKNCMCTTESSNRCTSPVIFNCILQTHETSVLIPRRLSSPAQDEFHRFLPSAPLSPGIPRTQAATHSGSWGLWTPLLAQHYADCRTSPSNTEWKLTSRSMLLALARYGRPAG